MPTSNRDVPELLPIISRGKHRNPRKGACFMELASYLAGERWSDHPACTHPLLAALARLVNDHMSDDARPRLGRLIPSVIGLTSDDPHVDARLALRSATTALPVAAAERQNALAVGVLVSEQVLAGLDARPVGSLQESSRHALAQVPHAEQWARRLTREGRTSAKDFRRYAAPNIVRCAVEGIGAACISDPDSMLYDLLVAAIADVEVVVHGGSAPSPTVDHAAWAAACRLSGGPNIPTPAE